MLNDALGSVSSDEHVVNSMKDAMAHWRLLNLHEQNGANYWLTIAQVRLRVFAHVNSVHKCTWKFPPQAC
jgi:hypothetical protein